MHNTINKLGIIIPYYNNNKVCEIQLKKLLDNLTKQSNATIVVVEDGQCSKWLDNYDIIVLRNEINQGVAKARNKGIDYLQDKVEYIGFIDSDDNVSSNYIEEILKYCDGINEKISTRFIKRNHINNEVIDITNRTSVTGRNYKSDIIGNLRFKPVFGEDNIFEHNIGETKEIYCNAEYYYEFGVNDNSIVMKEIKEGRVIQ